nr:progranulin [Parasteatoda tepidariorum]
MRLLFASVFCVFIYAVYADDCPQGLCPSSQTCCKGPSEGLYGCCPEPNAVCCTDGLHCCPQNTVCNIAAGTCDNQRIVPDLFLRKIRPVTVTSERMNKAFKATIVNCPGGQYFCPDGNTCCLLQDGSYGCCPYPSAVCCQDHLHCCPQSTHCDSTSTMCLSGGDRFSSLLKRRAFSMK